MQRSHGLLLAVCMAVSACGSDGALEGEAGDKPDDSDGPRGSQRDAGLLDARVAAGNRDASFSKPDRGLGSSPPADMGNCDTALEITVRDFTEAHPDFEHFGDALKGIVESQLGADKKPVYAASGGTSATTGPAEFKQWYSDVDGVNQRLSYRLEFVEQSPGVFVYDNSKFFPIDNMGAGNGPADQGITIPLFGTIGGGGAAEHNFLFTTEAHTVFRYRGGETFTFRGDDDMWVFLNGKLAIDLGGAHSALEASVDLDAEASRLGLEQGKSYPMDIFHAERHTNESNYRIETTIDLSCIENVDVPYI